MASSVIQIPAGYKQTDAGVIPEDWEVKELRDITTMVTNGFVGKAKDHYTDATDGITYIQGYNVKENSFNFHGIKKVTQDFHRKHQKSCLKEGDLLTVQTGDVGLTTIVTKKLQNSNCHALIISRFKKQISAPLYFSYYFNSWIGRYRLKDLETGTTMKHLNIGDMLFWKVPFPNDKNEQAVIAEVLSDIDSLISKLDQLIQKKKNIKQGAMQELLTGKRRLPGFSGEWKGIKIKDLFRVTRGLVLSMKKTTSLPTEKNRYPVYSSQTLNDGLAGYYSEYLFENCITWTTDGANAGDVKYRPGKFYCTNVCGVLESQDDQANSCIAAIFNSVSKKYVSYVGNPKLMNNVVAQIDLMIPGDIEEQKSISKVIDDLENELHVLQNQKRKYQNLKQGMMQQLLTGKIRLI